jgi:uncharacterized protein YciI
MKAIKGTRQYLAEGLRLEKSGNLPEAAASYEKIVDSDPSNQEAVARLLIIYRKLKEYRKELAVVDNAIGGYQEKDKAIQQEWLQAHPGAAGAGKAMLRSLGGGAVSAFGTDPVVNRLLKRKELLERKIGGGTVKRKSTRPSGGAVGKKDAPKRIPREKNKEVRPGTSKRRAAPATARAEKQAALKQRQKLAEQQRQEAKAEREAAAATRWEAAEWRRQQEKERKEAAAAKAQKIAAKKAAAAKAQQLAAKKAEAKAKSRPSLFVITLHYLVPLEQIDAEMHRHVAFLDKYYKSGDILVSGRQVPRTGGVIIAGVKDRHAAERMMKQDPFVRKKLASIEIMEFSASSVGKGVQHILKGG